MFLGVTGSTDPGNEVSGFTFFGSDGGLVHFRGLSGTTEDRGATLDKNEWIFPEITGNSGDINKLQIFMKLKPQN